MASRSAKSVYLKENWCKACGICIAFCPRQALSRGADGKPVWDAELCVRCALCEQRCPDFAIYLDDAK